MRFLADENVPAVTVSALQRLGHEVAWIRTRAPGASDERVLSIAISETRTLLTFDKGFGERARDVSLPPSCGVVLIRSAMRGPTDAARLAEILHGRDDWVGSFSVIEPGPRADATASKVRHENHAPG